MSKEIKVGSIVSIKGESGYYKITNYRGGKVNLGAIFGKSIYHKRVPVENVYENEDQWYNKWTQSETYMCM